MHEWNLKAGDPLALTIAADARLGPTDYLNDQIWELKLEGGDPSAVALQTTYGLRARSMRLFPRFAEKDQSVIDPAEFALPPSVRQFFPNYLRVRCSPFSEIDVELEYWVPHSQCVAGSIRIHNLSNTPRTLHLGWIAQLMPTEGQRMAPAVLQNAPLLAGVSADLAPVVFLTGGPEAVSRPYSALNLGVELPPGASRRFTWSHAALNDREASFELARQLVARPWEAEIARLEMLNSAQLEVYCGDTDWDAAFAFSQKLAYNTLVGPTAHLPAASFVLSRQPDQGYSLRGDGSDYNFLWNGQSPLELVYLAGILLPGGARCLQGLLRNVIASGQSGGSLDLNPGLAGQRSHLLATPLLANLAWRIYQVDHDQAFLDEVFQPILEFIQTWFTAEHDRDGDGVPEWDHLLQSGFEENPLFSRWHAWSQGVDISTAESPALEAMLFQECRSLIRMAMILGRPEVIPGLNSLSDHLQAALESAWEEKDHAYHYLDRNSHACTTGEKLGERTGPGEILIQRSFESAVRLVSRIITQGEATARPELFIYGENTSGQRRLEHVTQEQFHRVFGQTAMTGERVYARLERVDVQGIGENDHVTLHSVDYHSLDHTLLIPLWACMVDASRARFMVKKLITSTRRFWRPYGIPACPGKSKKTEAQMCTSAHLPWNAMIGEGLLAYGYREQAATLVCRIMSAIIQNLKKNGSFSRYYHADHGDGLGERNALAGLAPLDLFLKVLGVQISSSMEISLCGFNPYPWPVTVKYRGLTVLRLKDSTVITFPDGQSTTVTDPKPQVISLC